jgi:hypothetical protein
MSIHESIASDIAKCGFSTVMVPSLEGAFAYTIGFTELGHPEIFVSGLGPMAHQLFWDMYRAVKEGTRYEAGEINTTLATLPTAFRTLRPEAADEFCCQALYFYEDTGKTPAFLQLILPDKKGLLPWQAGYDSELMRYQRQLWVDLH